MEYNISFVHKSTVAKVNTWKVLIPNTFHPIKQFFHNLIGINEKQVRSLFEKHKVNA